MASLREIIDAAIAARLDTALDSALEDVMDNMVLDSKVAQANRARMPVSAVKAHAKQAVKAHRANKGDRVAYVVARKSAKIPPMAPMYEKCYRALLKRSPLTNTEIEKTTGLKEKTVESAMYQLRHLGLVRSISRDQLASKKGRKTA